AVTTMHHTLPMAQCSGYDGYHKITRANNVERGCCLDWSPQSDPVLASSPSLRQLAVVRKSPLKL
ncbi:hypothetical protein J6590_034719, partial [Homalodisca vitripennis]